MATLNYQTYESSSSLPSSWNYDTGLAIDTTSKVVGNNSLISPIGAIRATIQNALDGVSGNVVISATVMVDGTGNPTISFVSRLNSAVTANILAAGNQSYRTVTQIGSGVVNWTIIRRNGGTDNTLVTFAVGPELAYNTLYRFYFTINGAALKLEVQKVSNGTWLTPSVTWDATRVACMSFTDSTPLASTSSYHGFRYGTGTGSNVYLDEVRVSSLTTPSVSPTSVSVDSGSTTTITKSNFGQTNVTWSSSNTGIATVDSSGVVTGISAGTCNIIATGVYDSLETAVSAITVNSVGASPDVSPATATLNRGATQQLTATDFTGGSVTWSSSNTAVATVNSSGLVTAVGAGTSTITATGVSNTSQTDTATITGSTVAISVSPTSATLNTYTTQQLSKTVTGAVSVAATYSSSDTTVAIINSSGLITTTNKSGTATITATSSADNSKTATCVVSVSASLARVYPSNWRLPPGVKLYGTNVLTITSIVPTFDITEGAEYVNGRPYSSAYWPQLSANFESMVQRMSQLGINCVRHWCLWPECCSEFSPPYAFYTIAEHAQHAVQLARICAKYGLYFMPTACVGYVFGTPKLTFSQMATWITALVTALKDETNVIALDVMNEGLNFASNANAATLISASKAADATLPVTISKVGFDAANDWGTLDISTITAAGCDFIQVHAYYDFKPNDMAALETRTALPILIGEIGSTNSVDESLGRYVAAHDAINRTACVGSFIWAANGGPNSGPYTSLGLESVSSASGARLTGYVPKSPLKKGFSSRFTYAEPYDMRWRAIARGKVLSGWVMPYNSSGDHLNIQSANSGSLNSSNGAVEVCSYLSDVLAHPDCIVKSNTTCANADTTSSHITGFLFGVELSVPLTNRLFIGYSNTQSAWCIYQTVNGTTTVLGTGGPTLVAGNYYVEAKISSNGTQATLTVNGTIAVGPVTIPNTIKAGSRMGIALNGTVADQLSPRDYALQVDFPLVPENITLTSVASGQVVLGKTGGTNVNSRQWYRYVISNAALTTKNKISGQTGTTLTDTTVTDGLTYYYCCLCYDSSGNFERTNEIVATVVGNGSFPTTNEIANELLTSDVDGETLVETLRLMRAVLAGKAVHNNTDNTSKFKRADGTTDAITITHDTSGNRTISVPGDLN